MRNLPEWSVAFFAATLAGAIVTPLNAWWTGAELEYGLTDCGTKVADLSTPSGWRASPSICPTCPTSSASMWRARPRRRWATRARCELEAIIGHPDDLGAARRPGAARRRRSSPTTTRRSSTPAAPPASRRARSAPIATSSRTSWRAPRRRRAPVLRRGEPPPAADPDAPQKGTCCRCRSSTPPAATPMLSPSLFAGAKLVMMRKWDADRGDGADRARAASPAPAACRPSPGRSSSIPTRDEYDLSSLESISYGGAPVGARAGAPDQASVFPRPQPGKGWGMTETCATVTSNMAEDYEHRPDSCGPPVPVVRPADRRRRRQGAAGRRGRRALRLRPQCREGLLEQARSHRRDLRRRLGAHRRPGAHRRRGLLLHRRPRQGHADPRRREHLLRRGRERALRAPGRDGRGAGRPAAQDAGRGARCGRAR